MEYNRKIITNKSAAYNERVWHNGGGKVRI